MKLRQKAFLEDDHVQLRRVRIASGHSRARPIGLAPWLAFGLHTYRLESGPIHFIVLRSSMLHILYLATTRVTQAVL